MKLLASDYDGTIQFGDSVLEEDVEAIRKWRENGNKFAIITGRSKESITQMVDKHQIPVDYYVTNNGGMVFDGDGKMLLSSQLETTTAIDLMFATHEIPSVVSYMVNDGVNRHKVVVHGELPDHRYPHIQPDLSEDEIMDSGTFSQIVYSMRDTQSAMDTADSINQFFGSVVTAYPNGFVVDIVPHGISKATGLQFIQEYADVDDEDLYAIGDSYNDLPMLEQCMNSAAAGMAPELVRENAKWHYATLGSFIEDVESGAI